MIGRQALTTGDPSQVAREILSYFMRNPQAADNLEGVARWRLLDELVGRNIGETRSAIDWLVQHQFLIKTSLPGGDVVFSLDPEKRAAAQELLARPAAPGSSRGAERCP